MNCCSPGIARFAAEGLNVGIERANNTWVICVHQDVFLPPRPDHRLLDQLERATRQFGPIGVEGVDGVCKPREMVLSSRPARRTPPPREPTALRGQSRRSGFLTDKGSSTAVESLPKVSTLDELLLVLNPGIRPCD